MQKISVFVLVVGFAVSLVGCSIPVADSDTVSVHSSSEAPAWSAEPTSSSQTGQASSTGTGRPEPSASTSGAAAQPPASSSQPDGGSSQAPQPPSSQPPAASQTPASSQPPTSSQPPPEAPPAQAELPAATTAYDAPYNTDTIIADAQSYGASLGMTWSEGLNKDNCSWEAPIQTSTVLCGGRLKAAIESGIRRVQKLQQDNGYQPGEFHFKLYLEASGGEYSLYFLIG